ncbi:MAG: XTP/dITP diphosphatase [Deltaproteobacteria bacterium]|nr:XTP/dITP diphosphatase [Deltaproteobacteria bacterium]
MSAFTLVMATHNPGKVRELAALLGDLKVRLLSLADFPEIPDIPEEGATFQQNALAKAQAVAGLTGLPALADDSGLEVEALGGRPGVRSARYAADLTGGAPPTDRDNWLKLLKEMAGIPWERRGARFVCVAALAWPGGRVHATRGECSGVISFEPQGDQGFGYDPVFWVPEFKRTMAELPPAVKNNISHRARALAALKELLISLKIEGEAN